MRFVLNGIHFNEKFVCESTPDFYYSMLILFRWLQTGICQSCWRFENVENSRTLKDKNE